MRRMSSKTSGALDETKLNTFANKVFEDLSVTYVSLLCAIGDRLNIFKDLFANGPATSEELANRAGINERYAREWLSAIYCGGYLEYNPATRRFSLPPEHAEVLAHEGGPAFVGGAYQGLLAEVKILDKLAKVFKEGGGVPPQDYDENEWAGIERLTATWSENLLVQRWIPAIPDVKAKLERGIKVADVGCGRGRAIIRLAQAFPNSRYVGYDVHGPSVAQATTNAEAAGVADRVSFKQLDVTNGFSERYDLITSFDVIHDMVNPRKALREICKALVPNGTYLLLELNSKDKLEENVGPIGTLFYSWSVLYGMTTSLALGGEGLGTAGLPESKLREFCREAGFSQVRRLPIIEDPFNVVYEIKP
jgi:SAM-dependent methyltransferase